MSGSDADGDAPAEPENAAASEEAAVAMDVGRCSLVLSVLVESLVENLCFMYKLDPEKAKVLYTIICDHLFQKKMIDESYKMKEFEGIRTEYRRAFLQLFKNAMGGALTLKQALPNTDWIVSRYYQDFEEIECIGAGGFGQVYRVRNKLVDHEYAVKKIPIRVEGIKAVSSYLSEAKTLSSMNHPNIVQYNGAWLEVGAPSTCVITDGDEAESYAEETKRHLDEDYVYRWGSSHSFSDDRVVDDDDFEVNFEHSVGSVTDRSVRRLGRDKRASVSEGARAVCRLDAKEIEELKIREQARVQWATLYIQMALCQSTLKQWLERRNDAGDRALMPVNGRDRNETIFDVLTQLLKGLEYMHSKGIVHHDIKPSNIFVQIDNGNLLVQLGDFGLACPLQNVRHSLAMGTRLYAAPEQLAGKCDPKSDMYSLGTVLFELVERFRTDMERVEHIGELRKGRLPEHVHVQHPQLARIICQLVVKSSEDRPDATALLNSIRSTLDPHYKELKRQLAEKEKEISRLKELLKSAEIKSV